MRLVLIVLPIAMAAASAELLFSDDFDDGNADGWLEFFTGAEYTVENGWYRMTHSDPDEASAVSTNGDQAGSMSVADYSMRVQLSAEAGQVLIAVRYNVAQYTCYFFAVNPEDDYIAIARSDGLGTPVTLSANAYDLTYGEEYWARLEVCGNLLGAKIWQGTVSDEPGNWTLMANDDTYSGPGSIGLGGHDDDQGGSADLDVKYDNVEVFDDVSLDFDQSTWGSVKAAN